jgi:CBS domain containing-hemolysin-like protein
MTTVYALAFVLALGSHAVFAGAETALLFMNRLRMHHMARNGNVRVSELEELLRSPRDVQGAVRLALAVSRVVAVAVGLCLAEAVQGVSPWVGALWLGGALVVFGDALPRSWCRLRPVDRLGGMVGLLRAVEAALHPCVVRLPGRRRATGSEETGEGHVAMTPEALDRLMRDGAAVGAVSPTERVMIARVFALRKQPVRDIMVPAEKIVSVDATTTLAAFYGVSRRTGFIRMPVRGAADGSYVGTINVFYVVGSTVDAGRTVGDYMRPPLFVPVDMAVTDVLPRLRRNRQPMALVRDAAEHVVGLVTIEDVLGAVIRDSADGASARKPS